jgi:hypothetical protein
MDPTAWALYAFIAALVLLGTVAHYLRREPPGRGRPVLAALRGLVLALLVLLLFDPVVPAMGGPRTVPTIVLVDGSLSMRLAGADGRTRWREAADVMAAMDFDRLLRFGAGEAVELESPDAVEPVAPASQLAPALGAALEAGASRVVVVTDGAIEDAAEVERLVRARGVVLDVIRVGARTAGNLGLAELEVPGWARWGEEAAVQVGVSRLGEPVPDSVTVTARWRGAEVASARVATPAEGRVSPATLRFVPPDGMEGRVRLDVSIEEADSEPADNHRSGYLTVAEQPRGVALVSLRPDQEPRFLLPVLERALGLPARGWLAVGRDRFIRLGVGPEAGLADSEVEVRRALDEADLVVLHGFGPGAPDWAVGAAGSARVLLFPSEALGARVVGLAVGPLIPGEWYVADEIPASPVAPFLAAAETAGLPPLTGLRQLAPPGDWWTALNVRQDARGEAAPVLVAGVVQGRRLAVAAAEGYWRWAFAGGEARALYDALWAGTAAWLMEAWAPAGGEEVRPDPRVVERGTRLRWVVPPDTDSLDVRLVAVPGPVGGGATEGSGGREEADDAEPLDERIRAVEGVAFQSAPRPGHYRYEAVAHVGDGSVRGVGELTIERYSAEFTRPARLPGDVGSGVEPEGDAGPRPGRPLRSMPWPYLVLVVLLCSEWVLRRRWGLR